MKKDPESLIPEVKVPKIRVFNSETTATTGFRLNSKLDLEKEVNTLQEFGLKFVDTVERMLDIDPHRRDWQTAMIRLKQDAEKLLEGGV